MCDSKITLHCQNGFRLVDGTSPWNGQVEVWYGDSWNNLCFDYNYINSFDDVSSLICQEVGFPSQTNHIAFSSSSNPNPENFFYFKCTESENFLDCVQSRNDDLLPECFESVLIVTLGIVTASVQLSVMYVVTTNL
eukprot:Lithocolla_globosa_v1_NODE_9_length_11346_cov_34.130712.p5 type:complete len:136 gc:universal NODE_9_length_11346_cov_34.130712:4506-4913(+)